MNPRMDDGPLPGRLADRRTRSRPVPQAGAGSGEERSEDRAVHRSSAARDRIGKSPGKESMSRELTVDQILAGYDDKAPLADAYTIPAPWYVDKRIADLELDAVFSKTWQVVGRVDQVAKPGQFVTARVASE